ncbi:MAG: hypothetical protein AAF587_30345 [Bacteroidota bacterium]
MSIKGTKLELIRLITETEDKKLLNKAMKILSQAHTSKPVSSLAPKETELLLLINEGLPEDVQARYNDLLQKSVEKILTEEEEVELLEMLPSIEAKTAERLGYLVELAGLWNTTIDGVMDRLGITPPPVLHV